MPTFDEWFNEQFWRGWVIAQGNKPSEQEAKRSIYQNHLKEPFGHLKLDEIAEGSHIDNFKASLVERSNKGKISLKTINNILAPLSKALRYAEDKRVIERAPKVGVYKTERSEILSWELEEYPRILAAAKAEDPKWYAAVCLAGEAGLRVGEIRALVWERDIDLVAGDHMRPMPPEITNAARGEDDPDRRIVKMLGARSLVKADASNRTERRDFDVPAAQ